MTLFTAEGLLQAIAQFQMSGVGDPVTVVNAAYLRWLKTQGGSFGNSSCSGSARPA